MNTIRLQENDQKSIGRLKRLFFPDDCNGKIVLVDMLTETECRFITARIENHKINKGYCVIPDLKLQEIALHIIRNNPESNYPSVLFTRLEDNKYYGIVTVI